MPNRPFLIAVWPIAALLLSTGCEQQRSSRPAANTTSASSAGPVIEFTDENFAELVLASEQPVLVDFWAEWCGPCRMMTPVIDELAVEFEGRARIGKLNIDYHQAVVAKYKIKSIPSLIIFQNGEVVHRSVGVIAKDALASKLKTLLPAKVDN